jgi:putative hemolysin
MSLRRRNSAISPSSGTGAAAREGGRDKDGSTRSAGMSWSRRRSGRLVCCFRLMPLRGGGEIGRSYAAQYYELSALKAFDAPMVEMGRFCIHPEVKDPDILRVAWGAMTRFVDENGVEMIFGCSSFHGTDAQAYLDAFAMLKDGTWRRSGGCRGSRRRRLPLRPRIAAQAGRHGARC